MSCVLIDSRPRSAVPPAQKAQPRRPGQPVPPPAASGVRTPAFGAKLTVSLGELEDPEDEADILRREIAACGDQAIERVLRLGLKVKWEIDEGGVGGGWKAGESMDTSSLRLVSTDPPLIVRQTSLLSFVGLSEPGYRRCPSTCHSRTCRPSHSTPHHAANGTSHTSHHANSARIGDTSTRFTHFNTITSTSYPDHSLGISSHGPVRD